MVTEFADDAHSSMSAAHVGTVLGIAHAARFDRVDVHPIVFDAQGTGWQANVEGQEPFRYPEDAFDQGLIDGRVVDCLSVAQQLRFHHGYIHGERDNHDIALLETLIGGAGTT
jgi:hypothetical protein